MIPERGWQPPSERLLRPREVADLFNVSGKTVSRWASSGKLPYVRTIGGHRRFKASTVESLLEDRRLSDEAGSDAGDAEGAADT